MSRIDKNLESVGLSIIIIGLAITTIGLILLNIIPIFMIGLSTIIIGFLVMWAEKSNETLLKITNSAWENLVLIIEELGIFRRAIYIPSRYFDKELTLAVIPFSEVKNVPIKLPVRFSVRYGYDKSDIGIVVYTPGTEVVKLCKQEGAIGTDPEASLSNCIINYLGLAKRVTLYRTEKGYIVRIEKPIKLNLYEKSILEKILGTSLASIAASIIAEVVEKPVTVMSEEVQDKVHIIHLEEI